MLTFVLRRLGLMAITVAAISVISFALIEATPGSALDREISELQQQGGTIPQDQIESLRQSYGLDQPFYVKYWLWVSGLFTGDFGESFTLRAPVADVIGTPILYSVLLTALAMLFTWVIAIPIGVYAATRRNTLPDYVIAVLQFIGVAIPEFLLALLVLNFVGTSLGLDVGGLYSQEYVNAPMSWGKLLDLGQHVLPAVVVIAAGSTAWTTRVMRANLLDVLRAEYVDAARARGVREVVVVWKHAVRNAINPLIMAMGAALPALISGEAIIGIVLNLPTSGPMFLNALLNQDTYLAGTLLLFLSLLLVVGNLLADLALAWADPRIRVS
jgi:peptide/nickel transport system permease protein